MSEMCQLKVNLAPGFGVRSECLWAEPYGVTGMGESGVYRIGNYGVFAHLAVGDLVYAERVGEDLLVRLLLEAKDVVVYFHYGRPVADRGEFVAQREAFAAAGGQSEVLFPAALVTGFPGKGLDEVEALVARLTRPGWVVDYCADPAFRKSTMERGIQAA